MHTNWRIHNCWQANKAIEICGATRTIQARKEGGIEWEKDWILWIDGSNSDGVWWTTTTTTKSEPSKQSDRLDSWMWSKPSTSNETNKCIEVSHIPTTSPLSVAPTELPSARLVNARIEFCVLFSNLNYSPLPPTQPIVLSKWWLCVCMCVSSVNSEGSFGIASVCNIRPGMFLPNTQDRTNNLILIECMVRMNRNMKKQISKLDIESKLANGYSALQWKIRTRAKMRKRSKVAMEE